MAILVFACVGCGADTTVRVGDANEKGVVRTQIDRSRDVANAATARVQQGNKEMSGG